MMRNSTITKIIFIDIDGVLNSSYYDPVTGGGINNIEEKPVRNLKKIVDATGAIVVIISRANAAFGKTFDEERIKEIKQFGVEPYFSIPNNYYIGIECSKSYPIKRWLLLNNLENARFVVIDDYASNLKQEFGERFIHVRGYHGLAPIHVKKAITILNK